jgi:hypothetical protein
LFSIAVAFEGRLIADASLALSDKKIVNSTAFNYHIGSDTVAASLLSILVSFR